MTNTERYVYLLHITHSWDGRHWSDEGDPGTVLVFDDAWSAIQAGRAVLGVDIEKVHVEGREHAEGVVWIGGRQKDRMIVRRQKVWPTKELDG